MICVQRIPEPAALARNKAQWLQNLLLAQTKQERESAEKKYGHEDVKAALKAMFSGKCAYCESFILHVDYGDIEHFRPKSLQRFRALTFEWDNLLLACRVCNGPEHKGVKFPEASESGPFIDPTSEDPNDHLGFQFDPATRLASVSYKTARGRTTRDDFGLNRSALRERRSLAVEKLYVLSRFADSDPEAHELLKAAKSAAAEYAAFARSLA